MIACAPEISLSAQIARINEQIANQTATQMAQIANQTNSIRWNHFANLIYQIAGQFASIITLTN